MLAKAGTVWPIQPFKPTGIHRCIETYLDVVSSVEGFKIEFTIGFGCPQSKIYGVVGLEPWYRVIICNSAHLQGRSSSAEQVKAV